MLGRLEMRRSTRGRHGGAGGESETSEKKEGKRSRKLTEHPLPKPSSFDLENLTAAERSRGSKGKMSVVKEEQDQRKKRDSNDPHRQGKGRRRGDEKRTTDAFNSGTSLDLIGHSRIPD